MIAIALAAAGSAAADSITFYQDDNFRARQFTADQPVPNFDRSGFNDRVNSAVVHDGRWEICVDSEFRGECRTFGPGDYASLPGLNNTISSGRRISNDYPYTDRPNWQRDSFNQSLNSPVRQ
jgi:hypothetical protein